MLWESFLEPCIKQTLNRVSDGQGGFHLNLSDDLEFMAAIVKDGTPEEIVAEKEITRASYTVTVKEDIVLKYHDIIKRKRDNKIFRIVSDHIDTQPPDVASFKFSQVNAEEYTP